MGGLYYQDDIAKLYNSDCRDMTELADESVQTVVTSPPYWGLRKYAGLPDLVWGGDPNCGHSEMMADNIKHDNLRFRGEHSIVGNEKSKDIHPVHSWGEELSGRRERKVGDIKDTDSKEATKSASAFNSTGGQFCSLCGAWKGQLGLEPSPELYISHLVEIFREVKRVLRKDGVVFLNCGDSYAGVGGYLQKPNNKEHPFWSDAIFFERPRGRGIGHGIKPKDLCLIPFRLAIALQEDGWWVRSVIIWSKNNPMPESVTDRPTESHEYILMLTKSAKYYYDQEAVREPLSPAAIERYYYDTGFHDKRLLARKDEFTDSRRLYGFPQKRGYKSKHGTTFGEQEQFHGQDINSYPSGRNLRSVWTFSTQSYKEAHFATYPEELVRRCILAATPEVGCCPKCGKAWVRIIKKSKPPFRDTRTPGAHTPTGNGKIGGGALQQWLNEHPPETLGWKPQCSCGLPQSENIGSIVLDLFAGSGTTLAVAKRLGRRAVGYELSGKYCQLAVKRIETETAPMKLEYTNLTRLLEVIYGRKANTG